MDAGGLERRARQAPIPIRPPARTPSPASQRRTLPVRQGGAGEALVVFWECFGSAADATSNPGSPVFLRLFRTHAIIPQNVTGN